MIRYRYNRRWIVAAVAAAALLAAAPLGAATVFLDTTANHLRRAPIQVTVTVDAVSDIYGAALDLVYDPAYLEVVDDDPAAPGVQPRIVEEGLLNNSGADTTLVRARLQDDLPGTLVVGLTRLGGAAGVDAAAPSAVFTVEFISKKAGTTSINFDRQTLQTPLLADISVDTWQGFTLNLFPNYGDVNTTGTIDLMDAVLGFRIMNQLPVSLDSPPELAQIDVDGDARVGLPDMIYVMQWIAGQRSMPE